MYKIYFITFGCKVNHYETECMKSFFIFFDKIHVITTFAWYYITIYILSQDFRKHFCIVTVFYVFSFFRTFIYWRALLRQIILMGGYHHRSKKTGSHWRRNTGWYAVWTVQVLHRKHLTARYRHDKRCSENGKVLADAGLEYPYCQRRTCLEFQHNKRDSTVSLPWG